jgi:D-glycero-D-manno-heptose 1,7-bisphosphate phosphatase
MRKSKAVILDRDGTLIEDKNYSYKVEDFEILPGVIEGLKLLCNQFIFFIVTNQSGIGRGYYTIKDFYDYNNHLLKVLEQEQINIIKTYFCPHLKEENCECRKPKTKYIDEIIKEFNVDIQKSWMIGDHPSDIQFGINAGCRTIFLTTGHGDKHREELKSLGIKPTFVCDNFLEASKQILKLQ